MYNEIDNDKVLYLTVELTQILRNNNCTFLEAEKILDLVTSEIKEQREQLEYATFDDYFAGHKTSNADNEIIQQLNHVDGFC